MYVSCCFFFALTSLPLAGNTNTNTNTNTNANTMSVKLLLLLLCLNEPATCWKCRLRVLEGSHKTEIGTYFYPWKKKKIQSPRKFSWETDYFVMDHVWFNLCLLNIQVGPWEEPENRAIYSCWFNFFLFFKAILSCVLVYETPSI